MEFEPKRPQEKQPLPLRTVTAAILGFFPLIVTGYLIFLARGDQVQLSIILNYMWVIGLVISAWVLYLQLGFTEKSLAEFNRTPGRIGRDLTYALVLGLMLLLFGFGFKSISPRFSGFELFLKQILQTPSNLAIFLGPGLFLWAFYEELTRTFALNALWELVQSDWAKKVAIAVSAMVFALAYAYQGWAAMTATFLSSLLLGFFYQTKGRIIPMVLAHFILNLAAFAVRIFFFLG